MVYKVLHPVGGMNHSCQQGLPYIEVGKIHAVNLEQAFHRAQNDFSEAYRTFGVRSTSVGDILIDEDGDPFMVMDRGFELCKRFSIVVKNPQDLIISFPREVKLTILKEAASKNPEVFYELARILRGVAPCHGGIELEVINNIHSSVLHLN